MIVVSINNTLFAIDFKDMKKISLKKDEQKKILVKYGSVDKLFKFRWTLYIDGGLVVFKSYDKIVSQNILYDGTSRSMCKVYLMPKGLNYGRTPYMLLKFKEFDYKKQEALFELYIFDKDMQVLIEYLKNN